MAASSSRRATSPPWPRAEAEAKRRAEILAVMLGNIRHGIVLFDAERRIVASNSTLREMLGLAAEVMAPGRTQREMVEAMLEAGEYGKGEPAAEIARRILSRDRSQPYRGTRRRRDGGIFEVVSDPTPDGGWVVTYTDVSEDRRIRAELERARAAAEAASLAKSRFLATMSHELRTPLNAVIGFSEVLRDDLAPAQVHEFAGNIQEAGRHLLSLINDILDITRAEEGRLPVAEERVEVDALLAGAARMMSGQAEAARLRLDLQAPPGLPGLRGDGRRLSQILLNLLSNAIKFTPPRAASRSAPSAPTTAACASRCATAASASPPTTSAACSSPSPRWTAPCPAATPVQASACISAACWPRRRVATFPWTACRARAPPSACASPPQASSPDRSRPDGHPPLGHRPPVPRRPRPRGRPEAPARRHAGRRGWRAVPRIPRKRGHQPR
jgi:signal transduction histidine kinase